MKFRLSGAVLVAAASVLLAAAPAHADNYPIRDGAGASQTFCSKLVGGLQYPCHLLFGMFGATPTPVAVDGAGNIGVNVQSSTLPTGGASATLQSNQITQESAINTGLGDPTVAAWTGSGNGSLIAVEKYSAAKVEAVRALLASPLSVTGTVGISGTVPISIASLPALTAGSATIGTVNLGTIGGGATQTTLASVLAGVIAPEFTCGAATCARSTLYDASGNAIAFSDWTPGAAAVLAVATTTGRVALPTADKTVKLINNGAVDLNFKLGSVSVTAATTDTLLPAHSFSVVAAGANTYVAAITAASTTSLSVTTGTGSVVDGSVGGGSGAGGPVQLSAGEAHVGEVGGNQLTVAVAPTVTASSAYAAGNAVGSLMTVASAARVSSTAGAPGTSGLVQSVVVSAKTAQSTQVDVFLFDANPTASTCTDKTAFALAAADIGKVIGVASIPATSWFSGGTASVGQALNLALPYALSSSTSLYACAVTRATPTFGSTSDIAVGLRLVRN